MVGKTGSGKSSTGNTILGANLFDHDVGFDSRTFRSQLKHAQVHGKTIEIMDSPGLFDTHRTHEEILTDIVKAVTCMHPGPHAILYVIKLSRYTYEEYKVYTRLKALFDEDLAKYVIVIFTGGDVLEKEGRDIEEVMRKVPGNLREVLGDCQYRVVVFNNIAQDKRPYVTKLLQLVDSMLAENGGGYYTCPRYADVGEGMEAEVARRLTEMEKELLAEKPFIKELTAEEEQQKCLEMKRQVYQREIDQLKDRIVKDEETGFLDKIVHKVVGTVAGHLPDPLKTFAAKFLAK